MTSWVDDEEVDDNEKAALEENYEFDKKENMMLCQNLLSSGGSEVSLN